MSRWYSRPVLFVGSIDRSVEFYVQQLGFSESWRYAEEGWKVGLQAHGRAGSGWERAVLSVLERGQRRARPMSTESGDLLRNRSRSPAIVMPRKFVTDAPADSL